MSFASIVFGGPNTVFSSKSKVAFFDFEKFLGAPNPLFFEKKEQYNFRKNEFVIQNFFVSLKKMNGTKNQKRNYFAEQILTNTLDVKINFINFFSTYSPKIWWV